MKWSDSWYWCCVLYECCLPSRTNVITVIHNSNRWRLWANNIDDECWIMLDTSRNLGVFESDIESSDTIDAHLYIEPFCKATSSPEDVSCSAKRYWAISAFSTTVIMRKSADCTPTLDKIIPCSVWRLWDLEILKHRHLKSVKQSQFRGCVKVFPFVVQFVRKWLVPSKQYLQCKNKAHIPYWTALGHENNELC